MRALLIAPLLIVFPLFTVSADDAAEKKDAQVNYWIPKLGDADAKVRQQSAETLRKIGPGASAALRRLAHDADTAADVRTRAEDVLRGIEEDAAQADNKPLDVLPPPEQRQSRPQVRIRGFGADPDLAAARAQALAHAQANMLQARARAEAFAGPGGRFQRNFTATEDGRTVTVRESDLGITVTTTQEVDGKRVTRVAQARNVESLKRDHPEAFRVYEQYKDQMQAPPARWNRPGAPLALPPMQGLFDLDLPEAQRKEIERALNDAMAQANEALAGQMKLMDQHRRMMLDQRKVLEDLRKQMMDQMFNADRDAREDR